MKHCTHWLWSLALCLHASSMSAVFAQEPEVVDRPYIGELSVAVDLSNTTQRLWRVKELIPVKAGAVTLYYPKWIPGEHAPSGTLNRITGLVITQADTDARISWRRDLTDMYALHLDVPVGVRILQLEFQVIAANEGGAFGASNSVTSKMLMLEWNQVVFYPAGYYSRALRIHASAKLPASWRYATALETVSQDDNQLEFKTVSLEKLVDSPLLAGLNFKRIELAADEHPVHLNIAADHAEDLDIKDQALQSYRTLITEARDLFGTQHYDHYDFLYALSEDMGSFGLEHAQSSDDRTSSNYFTDADSFLARGALLPHEYVHSWNGKYRRPADLWTANFNMPMHGDLLWVYEGLTEYYGEVLAARSGLRNSEQFRDVLATVAARMNNRPGRDWRSLQDTADDAQDLYYTSNDWNSWRRDTDFYDEGELLWLEVDTLIRELSQSKRSLDDFAKVFFAGHDTGGVVKTYGFDDVVKTLNRVQPYNWAEFFRIRLNSNTDDAPLEGIARSGWSLVYTETPSDYFKALEKSGKYTNLFYSLGVRVDGGEKPGVIEDVLWGSAAFEAGLAPGMTIIAVNGEKYDADRLKAIVKAAVNDSKPIEVLVQSLDVFTTLKVSYHGGLRYPHLERVADRPDRLLEILRAKE